MPNTFPQSIDECNIFDCMPMFIISFIISCIILFIANFYLYKKLIKYAKEKYDIENYINYNLL